ncbi:MAG: phosphotransferase [Christensenellales bacterium]
MNPPEIMRTLNSYYAIRFERLEFLRNAGSITYAAHSGERRYFLRITKPAASETASSALDVHLFLLAKGFPVPRIIFTKEGLPCVKKSGQSLLLYEFIEGREVSPEEDAAAIGALTGNLHKIMAEYPGPLIERGKYGYIERYIGQIRKKGYPGGDEFAEYGESLWERVKYLPTGYCHGDLYSGNIHKTPDGRLYVLDFDTSCRGFPMYDLALICNRTNYFSFKEDGCFRSGETLARLLPEYLKLSSLSKQEINAFYDMIALYHFELQGRIIDSFGLDCVDNGFLDRQLDWLRKWREQSAKIK